MVIGEGRATSEQSARKIEKEEITGTENRGGWRITIWRMTVGSASYGARG